MGGQGSGRPRTKCRHCRKKNMDRGCRGLCRPCHKDPIIRGLYKPLRVRNPTIYEADADNRTLEEIDAVIAAQYPTMPGYQPWMTWPPQERR